MMEPGVLHTRGGIQLSFAPPHRIHDACIYPRKPLNGSSVIVYAHGDGLRVIWYAGRRLRPSKAPEVNGNNIDLTEDEDDNLPEYEDEEEEVNPMKPFHDVHTYKDINLGTAATKIGVPPLSIDHGHEYHQILNTHMFIFVACADTSLRLIKIPLEPSIQGTVEQQLNIRGPNSHQDLISNVAITITAATSEPDNARQGRSNSRTRSRQTNEAIANSQDVEDWSFLLASTSTTGTGLLLIHQIPIISNGQLSEAEEDLAPIQRRYLRFSLARCSLEFNPSSVPSNRHSNLLIASRDGSGAKVYEAMPRATTTRKRRGSTATVDSTASTSHSARRIINDKVLIDLHTPFAETDDGSAISKRKRILDAKWILHGRAILVLLEDGEWGVWDLEAAGPSVPSSSGNLVQGQSSVSGIQGGSLTRFAIKGSVATEHAPKKCAINGTKTNVDSSLAPMTPHTRKSRSQGLFKGQDHDIVEGNTQSARSTSGSLDVLVQLANRAGTQTQHESVLFSYGSTNTFLPSIQSYWRSEGGKQGSFDGLASTKLSVLPQLQTASEEINKACLIAQNLEENNNELSVTSKPTHNFLAVTSSRLVLFVAPLTGSPAAVQPLGLPVRLLQEPSMKQDQLLLDSGELDVDGMDRILDDMAQSTTNTTSNDAILPNLSERRGGGFQLDASEDDDDMEMDMETPTASKSSKSKLLVNRNTNEQDGRRRLFT